MREKAILPANFKTAFTRMRFQHFLGLSAIVSETTQKLFRLPAGCRNTGGKVLGEPMEIPGYGMYVSFLDTEGNRASLMEPFMGKE